MTAPHDVDPTHCPLELLFGFAAWSEPTESVLRHIADVSLAVVPGATSASAWEVGSDVVRSAVASDELAAVLDAVQLEEEVGPAADALSRGTASRVDDTRSGCTWPDFCSAAASHGVRSVLSLPMQGSHERTCCINLYATRPGAFSEHDEGKAQLVARHAGALVATSRACGEARDESQNLQHAMRTRAPIEQAKGIVMAANRCSPDEAFSILARASQHQNRKLRDIAIEIVRRTGQARRPAEARRGRPPAERP